jgi:hypothetical protein
MTNLFNASKVACNLTGRNLFSAVAAVMLGTTLIAAAAGPAVVANQAQTGVVTPDAQSHIVAAA